MFIFILFESVGVLFEGAFCCDSPHVTLSVLTSLKLFALYIFLESLTTIKNQNLSISFTNLRSDNKKDITNL